MAKRTRSDDASPADPAIGSLSYEEAVAKLETIIDRIESGEAGLEESIAEYERGAALVKRCREILGRAEQRIEELEAAALGKSGAAEAEPDADEEAPF